MPLHRLLKKLSHPSLVPLATKDTGSIVSTDKIDGHPSPQSIERTRTITRPWRRKRTLTGHSSVSRQSSMPPFTPKAEYPLPQGGMSEGPADKPLPPEPGVLVTTVSIVSSPDMMPVCSSPVQDKLAEAWDAVKGDARVAKMSREPHTAGICSLLRVLFFRINF